MSTLCPRSDLPKDLAQELADLFRKLSIPRIRQILFDRLLTAEEISLLRGTRKAGDDEFPFRVPTPRLLQVVAENRSCSIERALLDLVVDVNLISPGDRKGLLRALGEATDSASVGPKRVPSRAKPRWDRDHGELLVGDKVARKVRVCSTATRLQMILDAFEAAGWPDAIRQPFGHLATYADVHNAVHRLNEGLCFVAFHVQRGGTEITWQLKRK